MLGLIALSVSMGLASDLLVSVLIPGHPLLLVLLSDRIRNLALASPNLSPVAFYGVGFVRLIGPNPLFFLLGRWYGRRAVDWVDGKTPVVGSIVRDAQRWFDKAPRLLVAFLPINTVLVFAGASEMTFATFITVDLLGAAVLTFLVRQASTFFSRELLEAHHWIGTHRLLVFGMGVLVVGTTLWSHRNARANFAADTTGTSNGDEPASPVAAATSGVDGDGGSGPDS